MLEFVVLHQEFKSPIFFQLVILFVMLLSLTEL